MATISVAAAMKALGLGGKGQNKSVVSNECADQVHMAELHGGLFRTLQERDAPSFVFYRIGNGFIGRTKSAELTYCKDNQAIADFVTDESARQKLSGQRNLFD